ncbi:MAG: acylneuraminate cytidylyltransferase family protein [Candidatus Woesearchaeota archaeon]
MNIVSIIPARGGSKGIPGKNIKELAGKPLIAHTIEQSINSKLVTRTIVSTDDDEIAEISKKYGAEVVMRPDELAVDTAPSEPVILHVLDTLKEKEGWEPGLVVFLQCTSPLRKKDDIDNAISTLQKDEADSLLSVAPNHAFIWKYDREKKTAYSVNYDYKNRPRRQDMEPEYKENGSIYVTKPEIWRNENNRLGGRIALHVMDPADSLEIDDPFDFWLIERIIEYRKEQ